MAISHWVQTSPAMTAGFRETGMKALTCTKRARWAAAADHAFAKSLHNASQKSLLFLAGEQAGCREVSAVHGENQWPVQLPSFDCLLRQYIAACLRLGEIIMRGGPAASRIVATAFMAS